MSSTQESSLDSLICSTIPTTGDLADLYQFLACEPPAATFDLPKNPSIFFHDELQNISGSLRPSESRLLARLFKNAYRPDNEPLPSATGNVDLYSTVNRDVTAAVEQLAMGLTQQLGLTTFTRNHPVQNAEYNAALYAQRQPPATSPEPTEQRDDLLPLRSVSPPVRRAQSTPRYSTEMGRKTCSILAVRPSPFNKRTPIQRTLKTRISAEMLQEDNVPVSIRVKKIQARRESNVSPFSQIACGLQFPQATQTWETSPGSPQSADANVATEPDKRADISESETERSTDADMSESETEPSRESDGNNSHMPTLRLETIQGKAVVVVERARKISSTLPEPCSFEGCGNAFTCSDTVHSRTRTHRKALKYTEETNPSQSNCTRFRCDVDGCGNIYRRLFNLKRHHKEMHEKIRPYPCPFQGCGKAFKYSHKLDTHIVTHQKALKNKVVKVKKKKVEGPPFICDVEGCGKSYPWIGNLERHHQQQHTSIRPYPCPFEGCGTAYTHSNRYKLKAHIASHRKPSKKGEGPPFKCDVDGCGKIYSWLHGLERHHEKQHADKNAYPCPFKECGEAFTFNNKYRLHTHFRMFHKDALKKKSKKTNHDETRSVSSI